MTELARQTTATARCRSCDAPIEWALTAAGKHMPISPKAGGNIRVQLSLLGGPVTIVYVKPGKGTHISHFVDCPDAKNWRQQ